MANAAFPIMSAVNSLVPAGRTPLTQGIETAAEALELRSKPGVVVVITDGEEICGRSPCDLAKQLHATGYKLTVHVIAFRYSGFSWTGTGSVMDLMCVAKENGRPLHQGQQRGRTGRGAGEDARLPDGLAGTVTLREARRREATAMR